MSQKKEKMNSKKNHERMCICCGLMKKKEELLRIVKTKDGDILVDKTGKLNGRGAYICNDVECINKAESKKALERSFKCKIPDDTYDMLNKEFAVET